MTMRARSPLFLRLTIARVYIAPVSMQRWWAEGTGHYPLPMPSTNPIREALLEARQACVEATLSIDAALKKMEVVEGLRIIPRDGRLNDMLLEYLRIQAASLPLKTQIEVTPKDVHEALLLAGWDVTADAVHQAMYRMGKRGVLHKTGHGTYVMVVEKENDDGSQDMG